MSCRPSPATILWGNSVFWFNEDTATHHVSLCPAPVLPGDTTSDVVITQAHEYKCLLHFDGEVGVIDIEGTT